jgi:HlyD family secretion protein
MIHWAVAVPVVALVVTAIWVAIPRGLRVSSKEIQIAGVSRGLFSDELSFRANTDPLTSVFLDATDSGRVDAVQAIDGSLVKKGSVLFKLSNPQLQQQQLARESEIAQQVANLVSVRTSLETTRSDFRRRISDLEYEYSRAKKNHERSVSLAAKGFVTAALLDEALDKLVQQEKLLAEAKASMSAEISLRERAVAQMEDLLVRLGKGFDVSQKAVDALTVRAAIDGRLTDFRLREGESVKPGDKLGRIDALDGFKLVASIDEFHLGRVSLSLPGVAVADGTSYAVKVFRINPQIKEGRFVAELVFDKAAPPGLQPGQSLEVRISLGQPTTGLLLPDGAFFGDTGGAWVYLVDQSGKNAHRKQVKLGRRAAGKIEVLDGLNEGDRVIVSNYAAFADAKMLYLD